MKSVPVTNKLYTTGTLISIKNFAGHTHTLEDSKYYAKNESDCHLVLEHYIRTAKC